MIHIFDRYELDTVKIELRLGESVVAVEPQVFALLQLLIENRERLVGRDEIIERVWRGRIVSDAAVSSRIKSARQAIGDDGASQRLIRTIHKLGLRFVGEVTSASPATPAAVAVAREAQPETPGAEIARPSIAVLPFALVGAAGTHGAIADALAHDLIVELSRLRWLLVIARASSFQFRGAGAGVDRVRAALGVRYCLFGVVEVEGDRIVVTVELCDTRDGGVVWSEGYRGEIGAVHEIRSQIAQSVVGALELRIPLNEARRALAAPESLDAWAAYHLGLHHLFRFDRAGTECAGAFFEQAITKEPGFARAHAGLSFTHFESAFLSFADDRAGAAASARRSAERGLALDPLDPFCNLVMGRASWLGGDLESSLPWLDRALELNPNYALGKYSGGWARALLGQGDEGQSMVDAALELSPLDPLLYGMLGVRAFSHMALDQRAEAAHWAERAARAPRAHPLIEIIAAVAHGMNRDEARARAWARSARGRHPGLSATDFLDAFPFRDPATRGRVVGALSRLDL